MMVSSSHSENSVSEALDVCLSDWNLQINLLAITLDSRCTSHDLYSANLRDHLAKKTTPMLKGELFVVRCFVIALNVIAEDLISSVIGIIYKVCESEVCQSLSSPRRNFCRYCFATWHSWYKITVSSCYNNVEHRQSQHRQHNPSIKIHFFFFLINNWLKTLRERLVTWLVFHFYKS